MSNPKPKEKPKRSVPTPPNFNLWKRFVEQVRLCWRLFFDPRVSTLSKIVPLLGLAYAISPLDLMPDIFPLLGWLDDVGIILLTMSIFISFAPEEIVTEHLRALRNAPNYKVRHDKDGMIIDVKATPPIEEDEDDTDPQVAEQLNHDRLVDDEEEEEPVITVKRARKTTTRG